MIKQGLELKQTQKMSPLQILTIKLLELPIQSLEQKIRSELEENPVLDDSPDPNRSEESKDISIDELKDDDYIPSYKTRVNNWGNEYPDMRSKKKFYENENVLVRFQNLLNLSDYNYSEPEKNLSLDNLDPNSYEVCYSWNRNYYCYQGYAYTYGTGSSYECTSGGMGFPIRFLWQGGDASVIVPFGLVPMTYASYYYTLYYGTVRYTKPNYLPE